MASVPKRERVSELVRRLEGAPAAGSRAEARALLEQTLHAIEDELSGEPWSPERARPDSGRMYLAPDPVSAVYLETQGERIYLGEGGAIQIQQKDTRSPILDKPGADGRRWGEA